MVPKLLVEVLSSMPKSKKAAVCLTETIQVLDKLSSVLSYCAVRSEFNVNKSTIYIK